MDKALCLLRGDSVCHSIRYVPVHQGQLGFVTYIRPALRPVPHSRDEAYYGAADDMYARILHPDPDTAAAEGFRETAADSDTCLLPVRPLAIAKFLKKDFGKVKICTDTFLVSVGVVFMFVFFGHWDWKMIGPGTLVSMFYVGFMVRVFSPRIGWLDRIFIPQSERAGQASDQASSAGGTWGKYRIVTIARTYGSGGNAVGEEVARRLGCPCYSRQIIDRTAEQMGRTPEFVAENEQNISTGKLWEMIFEDSGIPVSMNPSKDDAIYVSQSRTIRELAHHGPCVIIGRLGNWILRDNPHVLRVFVTSGPDSAAIRVASRFNISEEDAARKVERVNTGRANHYRRYTGRQWTDIGEYDLMLNTDRVGIDGAVDTILRASKDLK